jgi:hypothetical protein
MLNMKLTLSAAILAATFAGTATQASAQTPQHYRGAFTLPFEARFGNAVLEPGSYTISTLEGARGVRITGEKTSVALLAAGSDAKPENGKARIILVDSNGMYALQTFESGTMGEALEFLVVKHPRGAAERAAVKPAAAKPTIELGLQ